MNVKQRYRFFTWINCRRCFWESEISRITRFFWKKDYQIQFRKIGGRKLLSQKEANNYISKLIDSDQPFWVARYGNTEINFINGVLFERYGGKKKPNPVWIPEKGIDQLCNNAGFFPSDLSLGEKYVDMVLEAAKNIDVHATWRQFMEDYIGVEYEKEAVFTKWFLHPYSMRKAASGIPWSSALSGKRILVVSPFAESIEKQYKENREQLFANIYPAEEILPQFELVTLKAVQTSGGTVDSRFENWFEALEWMISECRQIKFDVAIIGCGAYGFLLADAIKKMGKGAIQLCGGTQMLFGVLGKRWEQDDVFMKEVFNEYWIHPSKEEHPRGYRNVENGCYW